MLNMLFTCLARCLIPKYPIRIEEWKKTLFNVGLCSNKNINTQYHMHLPIFAISATLSPKELVVQQN